MADQTQQDDGAARRAAAGEKAQSDAESGASGSVINVEEYSGGGQDGDPCTMTDGRAGTVRRTAVGMKCVVEGDGSDGSASEK